MLYLKELLFCDKLEQEDYLRDLPMVQYFMAKEKLSFSSPITFFVGENGAGKSTLLEAIAVACGFNAEGGSKNFHFSTNETHSKLWQSLRPVRCGRPKDGFFLRAESLYNVATNIDQMDAEPSFDPPVIGGYGGVSLHRQSHGESFLSIVENRFFGDGLYLLDEPEAALSPSGLLRLMVAIHCLVKKNSQFIISTHSPILMTLPHAEILEFTQQGLQSVVYDQTEHYKLTKQFLNEPERMLHYLLQND